MASAGYIPDADINPFFDAVVQSVEEAILNALVANDDMTGRDGNFVPALPKAWLSEQIHCRLEGIGRAAVTSKTLRSS